MPEMIRDGSGRGYIAAVSSEGRILISGVQVTKEHHTNFFHQDAYNIIFNVTPTGVEDYFLYVKNASSNPIICEGFSIQCPTNKIIKIQLGVIGTPADGTAVTVVTPPNLTAGSGNQAIGTFRTGNSIAGLRGGVTCAQYYVEGSNDSNFRNFDADIIIPQNQTFAMFAINGGIECNGFLVMWHDHEGNSR